MRLKIVAANWKMHQNFAEGLQLAKAVIRTIRQQHNPTVQVVLIPPFIHLAAIKQLLPTPGHIHVGAQNCHENSAGAFTGEVSAPMLRSIGVSFVIIGHSERRQYFGENSMVLARKITTALTYSLRPIFCCGETWQQRAEDQQAAVVKAQLAESLFHLSPAQMAQVIIAYEPIWAIGTDKTPTPAQIQAMHAAIRRVIGHQYGKEIAEEIPILYGGSCNAQNAQTIFACAEVDGGLIGGASLQAATFRAIVHAFQ